MNFNYGRHTVIEIDLNAFQRNFQQFQQAIPPGTAIMTAVKANAYGHGAVPIAKAAINAGTTHLAVAFVDEGIELREAGIEVPILILGYTPHDAIADAIIYDLSMTVYTIGDLQAIESVASNLNRKACIHISIDTGMSRIGLQLEEVTMFLQALKCTKYVQVEGMYTHFSSADEKDKTYTLMQQTNFEKAVSKAEELQVHIPWIHSFNSAATIDMREIKGNMVRLGVALYGLYPSKDVDQQVISLQPILTFKSKVAHIKKVKEGMGVSYGATFTATGEEWIATIPVGYADGLSRQLSNKGFVLIKGMKVPIIGRICMDQLMLDVTKAMPIHVGDEVVIYGCQGKESLYVDEIADTLGTINYEVTCMLSRRIPRIYLKDDKPIEIINELRQSQ
ncbi:alanine racemase [Bacillus sp. 123MFChir2]|uniref:alanine racemase n=1 Tax=Bacillus sp. 123MFChir2 TaxID=1169144 RepID=UPI0003669DC5|nr:alanine racemase [Bacillus sp. 123MFChir2]